MRHSVRAALDPVDPFANKMRLSIDFHHRLLGVWGLGLGVLFSLTIEISLPGDGLDFLDRQAMLGG